MLNAKSYLSTILLIFCLISFNCSCSTFKAEFENFNQIGVLSKQLIISYGHGHNKSIVNSYPITKQFISIELDLKKLNNGMIFSFSNNSPFYLSWWFFTIILLLLFVSVYFIHKRYTSKIIDFSKDYSEFEYNLAETRLYLLILGIIFPLSELFIEFVKVRTNSAFWNNIATGLAFLFLYYLSKRSNFFKLKINLLFNIIFLVYALFVIYKSVFLPFELITFSEFLAVIFFSFGVFRNIKYSLIFNVSCFLIFCVFLFASGFIPIELSIVYLNSILIITVLNCIRYLVTRNAREKLVFVNNIMHNGNSIVISKNNSGQISFCTNNVFEILGHTPDELIGGDFNKLILNNEPTTIVESDGSLDIKIYTQKFTCKNGDYKFIQWQDKKHADNLYISIGEDITEKTKIQNDYQNLIQSANDIIYKTDSKGNFIFINNFSLSVTGYEMNELIGKHFTSLIRRDFVNRIKLFYAKYAKTISNYPTQEFPIVLKNGETMWVSQNVTIEKDSNNNIVSFSAIVRDITKFKDSENEKQNAQNKIEKHNLIIKELTLSQKSDLDGIDLILQNIIKNALKGLSVDFISIWNYLPDRLMCRMMFEKSKNETTRGSTLQEKLYPNFFKVISTGEVINIPDISISSLHKEVCNENFPLNNPKSLLLVPIFLDGTLKSIICFEEIKEIKNWDSEDVMFAKNISDVISISIEAQARKKAEKQLLFRGEILAAIAKTTEKLLASKDIQNTLNDSLPIIGKATRIDKVYFYAYEKHNQSLILKSEWANNNRSKQGYRNNLPITTLATIEPVSSYLVKNKYFFAITSKVEHLDFKQQLEGQNILSILALPIFIKDDFYGYIGFEDHKIPRVWSEDQLIVVQSLTTNIANAVERINNETIIKESESNFRMLNETIQDVFWLYDIKNKKHLYISPNVFQIMGISDVQFYQGLCSKIDLVFDEDKSILLESFDLLSKQDAYEIEYRIKIDNENYKWINEKSFAIKNENGELYRYSSICRDITEKKKTEAEIKQLSIVAEKTTNGILISDNLGKAVWANQGYLNMFEISAHELIGKFPRHLFRPGDADFFEQMESINGSNFSIEIPVQTFLKKPIWIELSSTPIYGQDGELIQQIEVLTDITEKIKAKKEIEQYSLDLEFQNKLKEKLINASSFEEITKETLGFVKSNIDNCIRISMFYLDEKKQNLIGYQLSNSKIVKDNYPVKEFKSFNVIKEGTIFIEKDLSNNSTNSSSDLDLIKLGVISYIVLPIISENELIGSLNIAFNAIFPLSNNEIKNLEIFSGLLAVALKQLNLKNALQAKNKDNISSLMYAKNIQNTILPNLKEMKQSLSQVCLLFKPKDIVSGDFYWAVENGDNTFIAVADCTGHGVPGAFLTLIGSRILEQIIMVDKITSPSEILTRLDHQLFTSLNIKQEGLVRDGMEISICTINKNTNKLIFSSAGMGLIYFDKNKEIYVKGQRKSIGDFRQENFYFENHEINVTGSETFFISTDGFQDQLGGANYKRLSKKKANEILFKIKDLEPTSQEEILNSELANFIGHHAQTDDITVVGFKIKIN